MLSATLFELLQSTFDGNFFPNETPERYGIPFCVWKGVGGQAGWYVDGSRPQHKHQRIRLWIWGKTQDEVEALQDEVEEVFATSTIVVEPLGAPTSEYDDTTGLYGSIQDFGIWYPRTA